MDALSVLVSKYVPAKVKEKAAKLLVQVISDQLSKNTEWEKQYSDYHGVLLCQRPADFPVNPGGVLTHKWLKTPNTEAGLGADGAGVPGHNSIPPHPWTKTAVNDHAGQSLLDDASCAPLQDVDVACVDQKLSLGPTGEVWKDENCWDFVEQVKDACSTKP